MGYVLILNLPHGKVEDSFPHGEQSPVVRQAFAGAKIPHYPYRRLEVVAGECFQSFASISNPGGILGLLRRGESGAKPLSREVSECGGGGKEAPKQGGREGPESRKREEEPPATAGRRLRNRRCAWDSHFCSGAELSNRTCKISPPYGY